MRCLYCGKELALLKRWTGGGEFCSDAHRQRYQEEYNQLALNRLLQAKPPAKPNEAPANDAKPAKSSPVLEPAPEAVAYSAPYTPPRPGTPPAEPASFKMAEAARTKPAYYETSSPVAVRETTEDHAQPAIPEPEVEPAYAEPAPPEEPAPAEAAGFLVEMPVPVVVDVPPMSRPDLEFLDAVAAALPNRSFEPLNLSRDEYRLETAGLVTFEPSHQAANYAAIGVRERRLEVREFVRTAPIVEIDLSPAGETGLETSSEAMDILVFPQPPQSMPVLWQEPPARFPEAGMELGALARLSFAATGFSGEESSGEAEQNSAVAIVAEPPAAENIAENPPVAIAVDLFPDLFQSVAVEAAPVPQPVVDQEADREVDQVVEQAAEQEVEHVAEPVAMQEAELKAEPEVEPMIEEVPQPAAQEVALPELITKQLPLTLHVAAPGRGKPLQVFSSAANAVQAQVPRSTSLPLRAVMTFGPAPAPIKNEVKKNEVKNEAKLEPRKPVAAPVRPDPRLANLKPRQTAAEAQEERKPAIKVPVAAAEVAAKQSVKPEISAVKPPAKVDKKPEAKESVKLKEEPKAPSVLPAPLSPPYPGSNELGLPRLSLQSSTGFLGQLPPLAKIGIVVVLLAGLGGLIAYSSKSGGAATTTHASTIVAGSALPAGEAGWITDWGAAPGVRSTRQISILRSSQTLTDYRIEMEGQIESKAIGWVFRAQDPKNFYVTKLEIVKPGLEPTIALVRFAIINGEEQAHAQLPLPMKVRLDTMYKIRFDAVGNHFTTYVQDEKVDDWTDDRVKTGGVGFYRERGEDATLKGGMSVVPLIVKK